MRRAQDRMHAARPYAIMIQRVATHLMQAQLEYKHPFTVEREEVSVVGYIIVSTDRGLCGGLNINLFRAVIEAMSEYDDKGVDIQIAAIGNKALGFFRRMGADIKCEASHLGDTPAIADLVGSVKLMLDSYYEGKIDRLYLVSNRFVNTMTQRPEIQQLLPIDSSQSDESLSHHWDYIYEPESKEVIDELLTRYIESLVYRGVVENIACEQSARMVAMKSASDNAGNLIDEMNLIYNKARQAAITQEISEIVGGAAAV